MLPQDTIQRLKTGVRENLEDSLALYRHFHANAELSEQEEQTSARVVRELEALAVPVTAGIGGHGVVGLLENGPGPVIMLRADMDALPIKEETGLEYACTATAKGYNGEETSVMHACGHDVHTTVLMGVARAMSGLKDLWQGTLIILAQPAEEGLGGARAMIEDGLWKRFPRPDAGLGLHVNPELAAGTVGLAEDYVCAGATSLDLIVRGMGGHGAYPHKTKDPVVLSAQIIMALQTIVSRGVNPLEPLVITAGSIHGGTKRNIIGEKVVLNLTVRSFNPEVMDQAVSDIRRAAEGTARAMGLPEDLLPQLVEAETPLPPGAQRPGTGPQDQVPLTGSSGPGQGQRLRAHDRERGLRHPGLGRPALSHGLLSPGLHQPGQAGRGQGKRGGGAPAPHLQVLSGPGGDPGDRHHHPFRGVPGAFPPGVRQADSGFISQSFKASRRIERTVQ